MKIIVAAAICVALFAAVVVMFASVLTLMSYTGGDMTEEMEQDFASNNEQETAAADSVPQMEPLSQKADV